MDSEDLEEEKVAPSAVQTYKPKLLLVGNQGHIYSEQASTVMGENQPNFLSLGTSMHTEEKFKGDDNIFFGQGIQEEEMKIVEGFIEDENKKEQEQVTRMNSMMLAKTAVHTSQERRRVRITENAAQVVPAAIEERSSVNFSNAAARPGVS